MKLCHVATVAFVWYLIAAPPGTQLDTKPFPPYSKWVIKNQFDNAYHCVKSRSDYIKSEGTSAKARRKQGMLSMCISSADPRLKASK